MTRGCIFSKIFFLGLFTGLLFVFVFAVPAQAGMRCKAGKPQLAVKTATTRTKYIRTKSSADLTNVHGGQGSQVGGLGGGEIGFKTESRFAIEEQGGRACVRLKRVEVIFYAKPEIHIASNFNRSTCEHNAVMAHEKGHIRILRKFVREYSPRVKKHLSKIAAKVDSDIGPIPKAKMKAAQEKIQDEFMRHIEAYQKSIMPVLAKRQNAYDNPAEYARVASKCRKWDQKLGAQQR